MAVNHPQAYGKMLKPHGEAPTDFERQVANLVLDIQNGSDLKPQMEELYITKAQEVPVGEKGHVRSAVVVWVPPPQLKAWHRIYTRLVRELEKKLDGKHVVFVAQRRILPKPTRKTAFKLKQRRPRSRTLTSVHENMLNDIVYPADIVGKRIRVKRDGSRLIKVHLDKDQQPVVSNKDSRKCLLFGASQTDTFAAVYKKLTGKAVTFEFPEPIFGREKK